MCVLKFPPSRPHHAAEVLYSGFADFTRTAQELDNFPKFAVRERVGCPQVLVLVQKWSPARFSNKSAGLSWKTSIRRLYESPLMTRVEIFVTDSTCLRLGTLALFSSLHGMSANRLQS